MSAPQVVIGNRSRIRAAYDADLHQRCAECQNVIVNKRHDARYCSPKCNRRAWYRAKKEAAQ